MASTHDQVTLPAMGESVREGTILEWHKQEGDAVEEGETIVEVSTDKVDAEVPRRLGTLVRISPLPARRSVGDVLAEIANGAPPASGNGAARQRRRSAGSRRAGARTPTPAPAARSSRSRAPTAPADVGERPRLAPRSLDIVAPAGGESVTEGTILEWAVSVGDEVARRRDDRRAVDRQGRHGAARARRRRHHRDPRRARRDRDGRPGHRADAAPALPPATAPPRVRARPSTPATARPPRPPRARRQRPRVAPISPVARRVAEAEGVDLAAVHGSGPAGRITKADVLSAKAAPPAQPPQDAAAPAPTAAARAAPPCSRATWTSRARSRPRPPSAR